MIDVKSAIPDQFRADQSRVQADCFLTNSGATAQRLTIVGVSLSVQCGVQPISACDLIAFPSVFNPCSIRGSNELKFLHGSHCIRSVKP
jgi:hypothetical protein